MTTDINCVFESEICYSYKLKNSIFDIDLEDWELVCQGCDSNIYMDVRFLLAVEKAMTDLSKFWYVIFYNSNGSPVACACLTTFKADLGVITDKNTKGIIDIIRQRLPSFMYYNVLFCGLPVSIGKNHIIFREKVDHNLILQLLDSLINKIATKEKIQIIIYKEFNSKECNQLDVLLKLGYLKIESLPMHIFQERFANFSEYCVALKSHYRNDIKRSSKKLKKDNLSIIHLKNTEKILKVYTPEIHQLYESVVQKSKNKLEILPIRFFQELAINFPEQLLFTFICKDDSVVAFNFSLCTQSSVHYLFCGINYSLNTKFDLYFNLMYAVLDEALKQNVKEIYFGQTADFFKARLGSSQTPLYIYIKGIKPILNFILCKTSNILFPQPTSIRSHNIYKY